jgi:general stress protein YciG
VWRLVYALRGGLGVARINVEDTIYKDPRFIRLATKLDGDIDKAIGCLVRAWSLAQQWYLKPSQLIPLSEWESQQINSAIIDVGLAERVDGFIRMKGADEQFAWLKQRSDAGRRGGLKSQANRDNDRQATESGRQASSSSSISFSNSDSISKKTTTKSSDDDALPKLALIWNQHRGGLPEVKASNPARDRKALARWKEANPNIPPEEYWSAVVRRIVASGFCTGKNDRGWRATFDWLLQPDTHLKVMEGKYGQAKVETDWANLLGVKDVPGST